MAEAPLVHRRTERGVAVLTLDSPHNRNALSAQLVKELTHCLDEVEDDPAARAVLLTHEGPTFSSGADLKADGVRKGTRLLLALMRRVLSLRKPVVARVDGHVRAGGIGLLAVCDISVAGAEATFAYTEARLGLAPSVISIPVLARTDHRAAARYFLTGETFRTAEAVRIGLVTAADDALDDILAGIRAASPQGLAFSKGLTTRLLWEKVANDGPRLARESARLFDSPEGQEGIRAFLERRDPPWTL